MCRRGTCTPGSLAFQHATLKSWEWPGDEANTLYKMDPKYDIVHMDYSSLWGCIQVNIHSELYDMSLT